MCLIYFVPGSTDYTNAYTRNKLIDNTNAEILIAFMTLTAYRVE